MPKLSTIVIYSLLLMCGLATVGCRTNHQAMQTAEHVDLERFMGPWFVQGYTPILVDKEAFNAVEHYYLDDESKIRTTYQFRKGAFDGELKTYTPVGTVYDSESNAEWRMQFIWPFQSKYIIFYLSDDYQQTIIAHPNRKYAWIMNRDPGIPEEIYQELLAQLVKEGFNPDDLFRVPQNWDHEPERLKHILEVGNSAPLAPK